MPDCELALIPSSILELDFGQFHFQVIAGFPCNLHVVHSLKQGRLFRGDFEVKLLQVLVACHWFPLQASPDILQLSYLLQVSVQRVGEGHSGINSFVEHLLVQMMKT